MWGDARGDVIGKQTLTPNDVGDVGCILRWVTRLGLSIGGGTRLSLGKRGSSMVGRSGFIHGIGDKEQRECVDGHIGAAGAETDPTQLLAVHDCKDDYVYGGCDKSNSCSDESTPGKASEAGGEPVGRTVEGVQK